MIRQYSQFVQKHCSTHGLLVLLAVGTLAVQTGSSGCNTDPSKNRLAFQRITDPGRPSNHAWADASLIDTLTGDEAGANLVTLRAAGDETVSFQFALRVGGANEMTETAVRVSPLASLQGVIEPRNLTVYRMHAVERGHWPGWHVRVVPPDQRKPVVDDVLVPIDAPRGGWPVLLSPENSYRFWVDVHVPRGAPAGEYAGALLVLPEADSDDTDALLEIPIRVQVDPFVLPVGDALPAIVSVDHEAIRQAAKQALAAEWKQDREPSNDDVSNAVDPASAAHAEMSGIDAAAEFALTDTLTILRRHRLNPVLPGLRPRARPRLPAGLDVDWSDYDRLAGPMLSGTMFAPFAPPLGLWSLPQPGFDYLEGRRSSKPGSPPHPDRSVDTLLRDFAREAVHHMEENGWFSRCVAFANAEPEPSEATFELAAGSARRLAGVHDDLRIGVALPPQDLAPFGWEDYPWRDLTEHINLWAPKAQYLDIASLRALPARKRHWWLNLDRPPFSGSVSIYARPADTLCIGWQARQLHAEAIYVGAINRWPDTQGPGALPPACLAREPGTLLYPGTPFGLSRPVPSVRLKRLRRTLTDIAYAELLHQHELDYVAEPIAAALSPYAGSKAYRTHLADGRKPGWPADTAAYGHARRIMADALTEKALGHLADATLKQSWLKDSAWRRFMLETRTLTMNIEGVRVRRNSPRDEHRFTAECWVTLLNRRRVPAQGTLTWGSDAPGWSSLPRPINPIAPNQTQRVLLTAQLDQLPTSASGAVDLPVWFFEIGGASLEASARLAVTSAVKVDEPIQIDGDVSEWPVGAINVMSDLVLITGEPAGANGAAQTRPTQGTIGFVLRDDRHLYVAVVSEWGQPPDRQGDERISFHRNAVTYDDMIPSQENLIELLIDPLSMASRSPADLYHLVIKQSGGQISERGIQLVPPVGRRLPWNIDWEVASRTSGKQWVVELRIPLSAFGEVPRKGQVWGWNLTRFDATRQEFSTWSGAVRNAYDPLNLGNLYFPADE